MLGFSADGRYLAFEQYGERDGDGQLFSEIVTVDVRDDRQEEGAIVEVWQPETPDKQRKPEQLTLEQVRRRAAAKAAPTLKRLAIGQHGAAIGEAPDSRAGDVLAPPQVKPVREAAQGVLALATSALGNASRLTLREQEMDVRRCRNVAMEGRPKGVVLALERDGRAPLTLTHDRNVPASRGCPDRYGLAAAYALPRPDGGTALAVFIQYFYMAFEGHDRRFFAVTAAVR